MDTDIERATSTDGTSIAFTRTGSGPSLVLVGGGLDDGSENAQLIPSLSSELTVLNYARRGRGGSGDTETYAVERELEDLAALLDAAGGSAHLVGSSSGGALALEAAAAGLPVDRLAVYDVPYSVGEEAVDRWLDYRRRLDAALSHGQADAALAAFMRLGGASDDAVEGARQTPFWASLASLAPTLAYDAAVLGRGGVPSARLAGIRQETLVLTRSGSDPDMPALSFDFFEAAAAAVTAAVPRATRHTIDAPGHAVSPAAVAPPLLDFFSAERAG